MVATIVLGLGSAVTIGCLQWLLAALARRNMPELLTLAIAQASAVIMLVGILHDHLWSSSPVWPLIGLLLFLGGGGSAVGYVCAFRAMEEGPVSLVAPVAGAAGVVAALIAITTGYDTFTWMHLLISLLLFGGILFCLVQPSQPDTWVALASGESTLLPVGLLYAIGSMVGFGVELFCSSAASSMLGPIQPVLWIRVGSAVLLSGVVLVSRGRGVSRARQGSPFLPSRLFVLGVGAMGVGLLDAAGMWLYNSTALRVGTSLAAGFSALNILVPILIGFLLYRERLSGLQTVGMGMVVTSLFLLSVV